MVGYDQMYHKTRYWALYVNIRHNLMYRYQHKSKSLLKVQIFLYVKIIIIEKYLFDLTACSEM